MLRWLVRGALNQRVAVVALALVMIVVSARILPDTPLDVFPEFAPPLVEVQTEAPGLSTTEVESLVTIPIENALSGIPSVDTLRSRSVLGLSSVVLILTEGTDVMVARQLVQERLAIVQSQLPTASGAPVILPPLSATSRVLKIGLSSATLSQMDMTTLARWTIRPRLMAVPGVANVAIWGQRDRELQVLVDPERLIAHDSTLNAVVEATGTAVSLEAGGYIDTPNQRMAISYRPAVLTAEDLAQVPVAFRGGTPLLLGDVADIREGFPPPIGDAVIDGGPGLLLIVEKHPSGNTLDVTEGVERALDAMRPGLAELKIDSTIFRPATFIEMALDNLGSALIVGAILVALILVSFLYEWRTALISLLAIPVSLVAALMVLHYFGTTINTMVLAGLIIALGEVVDDAIIDVENIVRRLRLNRVAEQPKPVFEVVLNASLEVRSAIVFATFIVVLVFVPVFFLPGLSGAFFRPLAVSYVLAVLASLVVALTLTPALTLMLLGRNAGGHRESPLIRALKAAYRFVLARTIDRGRLAAIVLLVIVGFTAVMVPLMGERFLPDFQERDFLMHWLGKPGTSLEAMQRSTTLVSQELLSIPGVRNFGAHIGRAEVADEVVGPEFTELWVSLDPEVDYQPTVARIQEVIDGYPGIFRDLLTYLEERIKEVLTGASATVVVRIYGPNLDILRAKAAEVSDQIATIPGVVDLQVEPQNPIPTVEVAYQHGPGQQMGLTPGDLRKATTTLLHGVKVGEIYKDQEIIEVIVRGVDPLRRDPQALRRIRIDTPSGGAVPLGDIADIQIVATPNLIRREGASRRIDVTLNVAGRDLGTVATEVEQAVRAMEFEQGYFPEFVGEYAAQKDARNTLLGLGALSVLGILLLLQSDFKSLRLVFLVFVSLPFALVGGVASVFWTGGVLSLGSLVGFVTVLGIAARNGIMLVSHYRHLERDEGMAPGRALLIRGAQERLAPILMTALTTALALTPIAIAGNSPGYEIEHPMAVVIIGGLVTSTVLNLLFLPALYGMRWTRSKASGEIALHQPRPS